MKKFATFSVLAAGTIFVSPLLSPVHAETNQDKLSTIESELEGQQSDLQNKSAEKEQIEKEIQELQKKIDELTISINKNEADLNDTKKEISKTQQVIAEKKKHIEQLQINIDTRQDVIKQRLQSMQEKPRTNIITEVLTNSNNIADLVDNIYSVSLILNNDTDIVKKQTSDQEAVTAEKEAVEKKEQQLEESKQKLEHKQQELQANQQQQQALINDLHTKVSKVDSEIEGLEESKSILENQRQAVQKAIEEEKRAEKARKAEEARKAEDAKKQSAPTPQDTNKGGFIKPAAGSKTSGFGARSLDNHKGIDIAAAGTVPIIAAADGVVIRSELSSSYGNVVYLSHRINGKTYTTVYAHMSSRSVSNGQTVKQGQQLGFMGNTGQSFGQHLHFELHIGEWNVGKTNAVDPSSYIGL
ncbi:MULTISPECIES: murein hydrolase activator EnvC family protein [Bacillus]|uniref:murein hydrolase activator EnvC family protein n=1 Tax=Bacillus TaxID=1386 RepID=UPI0001A138E1|nr:M23 family metallopeptidase [Bacillus pseudomycoides]EEM17665.1 Peptidase, family M23/M37 [Bacillus pseudomycoides DSM 12442]MED1596535.1 peptidoglycan DD-metalloendopeptidase family protein [Bacillus pseudomycoides]MED4710329.1 peptidoglycan DD-metalloendopeptidase family protein [Bacillus pseudomycoides]OOR54137.1 peptidase M24 [Bacillus pseudomycoides]PDY12894.1 peptidase M24 [Bacillus pseudomycoides]